MTLRTLLLATYHFPPSSASGSFRLLGFVRHLLTHGWRTVVVAPPCMPFEPVDNRLSLKLPPETVVYSVPFPRGNRLTRRLMPFAAWVPAALKACTRAVAVEHPEALLTSSPPPMIHLLGRLLKARYSLPWLADYRDPWAYGHGNGFVPGWPVWWEALKERAVLRSADSIIVNTPLAREALLHEVPACASKVAAITNGFDPESFVTRAAREKRPAHFAILHTGELYSGRDPRPLFDALVGLQLRPQLPPLRLTFMGQSSDPNHDWPAEARRRGLEDVVCFAGHVQYKEALARMQVADILLLVDSPGRRVGIPAKLFEYLGARRPILALADAQGDVGWALRASGARHRIAAPTDAAQIRQALTELIDESIRHESNGSQPISSEFTRFHTAGQLAALLDRLTGSPAHLQEASCGH
jgi:glycosyltransferase involved in cell wall biosynthesis